MADDQQIQRSISKIRTTDTTRSIHQMSAPYVQYHIPDDADDTWFDELIRKTPPPPTAADIVIIKELCADMRDVDVRRVIKLTQYQGNQDVSHWRGRVPRWTDREARYVINCLRWEHYQSHVAELLNSEDFERRAREQPAGQQQQEQQPPQQQQQSEQMEDPDA